MLPSILLVQREYDHSLLVSYSAKSQAWSLIKIPDTVKSVALKHWNFQHCGGREILIILNFFDYFDKVFFLVQEILIIMHH